MAKSENQKLKILYLLEMLKEHSDEDHVLSMQDILAKLDEKGIKAERKSIYTDIDSLNTYGYDILYKKGKADSGYYMASRDFELAELKLLVDAVQSSRFMTLKKSRELIKKLETLASRHQASQLQRQVYVVGRVKTENERIYYNVDSIYKAIDDNVKISFQYMEWTVSKELKPKKSGEKYTVSPWALIWEDEYYYLAAYDDSAQMIKHYRVDKIEKVTLEDIPRDGREQFEQMNLAEFSKKTFGMYGGEEETVTLQFASHLAGVVIDRFGKDAEIRKLDESSFKVRVKARVSGQFFGWLAGIGQDAKVLSPEHVKDEYRQWLQSVLDAQ